MKFKAGLSLNNYFLQLFHSSNEIMNDPLLTLPQEINDFNLVLDEKDDYEKNIKNIYINRKYIFDDLFDLEEKINIKNMMNNLINNKFEIFLYYLCLLIEENKDIVYFSYSMDFIKNIKTNLIKNDTNNTYMNIILCKILIVLINNYITENDMNSNRELINIKNELEQLIKNDSRILKEINNNDLTPEKIASKNLDDIYVDIILTILNTDTNDDYKNAIRILNQLNLEVIDIINKNIYDKIFLALNEFKFKKKYLIKNLEDFNDPNKIGMYFVLLKYIFKDSLYIYQIPFLLEARKTLLKCIKKHKEQVINEQNNFKKNFILKKLFDSDYYIKKYFGEEFTFENKFENEIEEEEINNKEIKEEHIEEIEDNKDINEVLTFYRNYKFETKKNDIEVIETSLKTKDKKTCEKYLADLKDAKEMNPKYDIISFYHINNGNKNKALTEKDLKKSSESYQRVEKIIKDKKLNKINIKTNKIIYEYFKNSSKTEQLLKIYKREEYDLFLKFNRLKEIYQYYSNFLFESKKNDIKLIENIIKEIAHNNDDINLYLRDLLIAEKMNLRYHLIQMVYKIENKENKITSEKKLEKIVSLWDKYIEKSIIEKQRDYNELSFETKNELLKYFKNKENEEYLLKIFNKDAIEFFKNLEFDEKENENETQEMKFISVSKNEEKIEIKEKVDIKEKVEIKEKIEINEKDIKIKNNSLKPQKTLDNVVDLEETEFKKILPNLLKYNENSGLNEHDLLLMIDIYGDKNALSKTEIKKEQFDILAKKYIALKKNINDRKKNKLNRNIKKEAEIYFNDIKNTNKLLRVFSKDDINWFTNKELAKEIETAKEKPVKIDKKDKFSLEIINKLNEVLIYYKNFYPEKKEDINNINQILEEQNKNDKRINQYLNEYEKAKDLNIRYPFIEYLFEIRKKEKKVKSINDVLNAWEIIEDMIKSGKFNKMREKKNILKFFKEDRNKNAILKIFTEEQFNKFIDEKNHEIKDKNIIISKSTQEKLSPEIINNLETILNYYKNFFFETKKDDIDLLEKAINQGEKINHEKYLKDLDEAIKMNKKYKIIEILLKVENKGKKKTEKEIEKAKKSYNTIEKVIKDKKATKMNKSIKTPLLEFFSNKDNQPLLLEIFTQEQIDFFLGQNIQKKPDENINKLKIVLEYYQNYYFKSKLEEINSITEIINGSKRNYDQYLKDFDLNIAQKKNLVYPLIIIIYNHSNKGKKDKTEKNIEDSYKVWTKYEDMINTQKIKKIPKTIREQFIEYFNDEQNKERLITIFGKENFEFFKNKENHKEKSKKINEEDINKLKIVLSYYENYSFETNKDDIIFLKEAIKKGEEFEYKKYLENIDEKINMNNKYPLIEICFKANNKGKQKTEKEIEKAKKSYNTIEKVIKDKKATKMNKSIKTPLLEFFSNKDNQPLLLEIFTQEQIDFFLGQNIQKKPEEDKKLEEKKPEEKVVEEKQTKEKISEKKPEGEKLEKITKEKISEKKIEEEKPEGKISQEKINKLEEVLHYYNNYYFETKNKEIDELAEIIKNCNGKYDQYLKDFDEAKTMNIRYQLILLLLNNSKKAKKEKNEKNLKDTVKTWTQCEGMINKKSWNRMNKETRKVLFEYFNDEKNKENLLEIFEPDKYEFFKDVNNHPEFKKKNKDENEINNLKIILTYYQNYLFETKKEAIILLEKAIKGEEIDYKEFLTDLEISKTKNNEFPIINYLYEIFEAKTKGKIRKESKIKDQVKKFETFKKLIKERKGIKKLPKPTKNAMITYFQKEENKKILLDIFTQDDFDWFLNETKENLTIKLSEEIINNLNIVLNYYKNFYFESKKEEIKFLEEAIKKGEEFDYKKYLENLDDKRKKNDKFPIIEYIFNKNNEKENKTKTEKEMNNLLEYFEKLENAIKKNIDEDIYLYLEESKLYPIFDYIKDLKNQEILLKIFSKEEIEFLSEKEIINEDIISNLEEIKKYYQIYLFESKSNEINTINEIIKNRKGKYENYLKDLDKAKKMILRLPLVNILLDEKNKNNEKDIGEAAQHLEIIEKMIKDKKSIDKMKKNKLLIKKLKEDNIKDLLYKIIEKDAVNEFLKKIDEAEDRSNKREILKKLKSVLKYFKDYQPDEKKEEIILLENEIKNRNISIYEKFSKDYEELKKLKKRENVINYIYNTQGENQNKENVNKFLNDFDKLLNSGKSRKMKKHHKSMMLNYMDKEEKGEITNQYYTQEQRDLLKKNFN